MKYNKNKTIFQYFSLLGNNQAKKPYHIEKSQSIRNANQMTGIYMTRTPTESNFRIDHRNRYIACKKQTNKKTPVKSLYSGKNSGISLRRH